MRAPDARDRALVAEERVELTSLAVQDLGEPGRVEVERIGPEMGEILVELACVTSHTPARFFFPASVRTSSPPSGKRSGTSASSAPSRRA